MTMVAIKVPEFTYEESDNYIYANEVAGYSDGKLINEYFGVLRAVKAGHRDFNYRLSIDTLSAELEKRGLLKDGMVVRKKKDEKKK